MIELVVVLVIVGIACWGIMALPIPQLFKTLIWCVIAIGLVLYLAAFFGHPVGHFGRK